MTLESESWVGVAFVIFFTVLGYLGVHRKLLGAIDDRRAQIRNEIDQADGLEAQARALLADAERKRGQIEQQVREIADSARAEADLLVAEAKKAAEEWVRRRQRLAAVRIEQAESRALAQVRNTAAEFAVAAAEQMLTDWVHAQGADQVVGRELEVLTKCWHSSS
jgi:F-type H+-transporting ATPase subunit b